MPSFFVLTVFKEFVMLKIISWNCQGAFRNKYENILALKPDILIVLECEPLEHLKSCGFLNLTKDVLWYSDTGKKGIGIFSFCDYKFKLLKIHNPEFRYILPFMVYNESRSFSMLAVWALDDKNDPIESYVGQVWNAINFYTSLLKDNCILVGDLNSNQIWDRDRNVGNHSSVVSFLLSYNITSLYHYFFKEEHGQETKKTFFLQRNPSKTYHIDYLFASKSFISNKMKFDVGLFDDWCKISDHVPIIAELDIPLNSLCPNPFFIDLIDDDIKNYSDAFKRKFSEEIFLLQQMALEADILQFDKNKLFRKQKNFKKLESFYNSIF